MKRLCSLPFVPTDFLNVALKIFEDILEEIGTEDPVWSFSRDIVDYVKRTWVSGTFSVQDWNLFDIGIN